MTDATVEQIIDALVERARAQPDERDGSLFIDFLRAYFAAAHADHLADRSQEELLSLARQHYQLAGERQPGAAKIEVLEARAAGSSRCSAVMTVVPDMPFLVDSVSMAVRDVGAAIDWILHPVLRLQRDQTGAISGIVGHAGADSRGDEESFIYIQCDALSQRQRQDLVQRLQGVLADLQVVVADFDSMTSRLQAVVEELQRLSEGEADTEERDEAQAFLRWLANDHFMFLGYLERRVESAGDEALVSVPDSGLGLLRSDRADQDPDGYVAPAAEIDKYALSPRLLVVTKANRRAWLHYAEYMDVIAVKRIDENGRVIGAHRFLGLFAGEAYAASPRQIPVLRRKIRDVTSRAGLRPGSHNAKALRYTLDTFPRDELLQSGEDELYATALGVLALRESQRLRLFMRRDRYGRFYACLVYLPRERYALALRRRIGRLLAEMIGGEERESTAEFLRGALVRSHHIISIMPGSEPAFSHEQIEARLLEATRTWLDDFRAALGQLDDPLTAERLQERYADAFTPAYTDHTDGAEALDDATVLEELAQAAPPAIRLLPAGSNACLRLKLYGRGPEPALATILPVLENFGLRVQTQRPFAVTPKDGQAAWIHEFEATHEQAVLLDEPAARGRVEQAFAHTWQGEGENDGLNRLVIGAGLDWRRVALLRTITRYLLQTRLPFSQGYIESLLTGNAPIVRRLVDLFYARFDPDLSGDRQREELSIVQAIDHALDQVASLDADRALRACLGVILAGLRTNYFQPNAQGAAKPYISIKLNPAKVPELPRPVPMFEAFVYAPEVEGIHLRGGQVARGGLRWSDRREDFRTEVLGLMKAQMVKNSVIVPVGAKGGFVVKNAPADEDRDARQQRGIACYKTFIRGLLDITDNRVGDDIIPPKNVLRHDPDDPYLVVAADKGTASFSDIANGLSAEYDFWLDDAFASGGSAGYDHKVMGITARGGWEGVKRHFRELGHDTQNEPFTVVGIGDMGGDVFGNGMLLSRHIKLVAAFNHKHIFIDPDPDPEASYGERERLFNASASGWDAYDESLISAGGGVYQRSDKSIALSERAREVLGLESKTQAPIELIHELLNAPADLLWNGGIGTYVKAAYEAHADVGDRANDNLRVNGKDLRCKVVGEGGNLGLTQAGRIEFARNGGRLNTDAIDNSGGVDSSDLEVNIKIALNAAERDGVLQREARNRLLTDMTDTVIDLVLRTNYLQTQLISVIEGDAAERLDEHVNFIRDLERDGLLDRRIEGLPDEEAIDERMRNNAGLTRPEIAVLLSYGKISLFSAVLDSSLPDEAYLETTLFEGFPEDMRGPHAPHIQTHRLRREIIATLLTNQMVDRMGFALAHRLAAERGVAHATVVRAFVLASALFDSEALWQQVETLDNQVATDQQYRLLKMVAGLVKHTIGWMIARPMQQRDLTEWVDLYADNARRLLAELPDFLRGAYLSKWQAERDELTAEGVSDDLAARLASVHRAGGALDILELTQTAKTDLATIAPLYFAVGDWLSLPWLQGAIQSLQADDRWQALARASLRDDCYRAHRRIVADVLACEGEDASARIRDWHEGQAFTVDFVRQRLSDLQAGEQPTFAHLAVAVRDLASLGSV